MKVTCIWLANRSYTAVRNVWRLKLRPQKPTRRLVSCRPMAAF